jgi:hypothetical protein
MTAKAIRKAAGAAALKSGSWAAWTSSGDPFEVCIYRGGHEALRKIAFEERVKIHDLVVEGLEGVLRRRGYPADALKSRRVKKP